MSLPPNRSPLWGLAALVIVCTTLTTCLSTLYRHGFVLDKDGWTVFWTAISAAIVPVVRSIYGGKS